MATGGSAVMGGLYTASAATAGAARTVGGTAIGAAGTALAAATLSAGEAVIGAVGVTRAAGVTVAGTALTAGALALGGLKMTGHATYGTVKMVGITALGAASEVLVPAVGTVVTGYRVGKIAGTAIVDNVIITPAVATWDILTALTLGGWELVKDPVKGTFHLVAAVGGFSYSLVGLTTATAVTAVAGGLYAIVKAPLSLVFYGGMWMIAAGGKLIDGVLAPLAFDTQNVWKKERQPQLEEILGKQPESIRSEIGDKVTYIRVVFSGEDRGKVNFFTTEREGKRFKFVRHVQGNCLVVYRSDDTKIELNSGLYDRHCVKGMR
jgi:hypothetical protein